MTRCVFCERSSLKAKSRSHSNIGTIRRQHVNLQRRWLGGFRAAVCTKCIKTAKKREAVSVAATTAAA